jgi:lycopene cyclase domain-containing protein
MFTYLILNLVFIFLLLLAFGQKYFTKNNMIVIGILILSSAVFDQLIIGLDIVDYNPDKILGLFIYKAPVEDFFYCIGSVIIVSNLWRIFSEKYPKENK